MTRKALRSLACILGLIVSCASWGAESPTVHDIYLAAQSGRLTEAQSLVEQVVAEHPKSSKAHYVAAEIYAKEGKLAIAKNELQTAEQLEPGLTYVKPQALTTLKQSIGYGSTTQNAMPFSSPAPASGFPWGMFLLLVGAIVVITMIFRAFANRNAPQVISGNAGPAYPNPGYAPGPYAPAPQGSGLGSSIMGGLATGAALGAGMVAGEALAHNLMGGGHAENTPAPQPLDSSFNTSNNDMGGQNFGIADNSSWDDGNSFADISGGDDWS